MPFSQFSALAVWEVLIVCSHLVENFEPLWQIARGKEAGRVPVRARRSGRWRGSSVPLWDLPVWQVLIIVRFKHPKSDRHVASAMLALKTISNSPCLAEGAEAGHVPGRARSTGHWRGGYVPPSWDPQGPAPSCSCRMSRKPAGPRALTTGYATK